MTADITHQDNNGTCSLHVIWDSKWTFSNTDKETDPEQTTHGIIYTQKMLITSVKLTYKLNVNLIHKV